MKFGLLLTTQHRLNDNPQDVLGGHLSMLRDARRYGWHSFWGGQHFLQTGLAGMQPNPLLGRLAAEAPEMVMGLSIQLLALQNPVAAAEDVATLDVISGGRFVYGVGLGYREIEYSAFGLSRPEAVRRFERNLEVVKALLSGRSIDVDLPWCRVTDVALSMQTLQRPRPPVWIAANNDAAVERAARLGDAWLINPHASVKTILRQKELFDTTRRDAGLPAPSETPMLREVICARESRTAHELAQEYLSSKYKSYVDWGQDRALPLDDRGFEGSYETLAEDRFVVGSPDECLEQLRYIVSSVGVDHLIFRVNWPGMPFAASRTTISLLSEEVLPGLLES